ncbi:MAG: mechanosensitive ion channel [Campylobacterales bacterium]|nr:mechanosensitive ion channel [Campylobacterales bacterium]
MSPIKMVLLAALLAGNTLYADIKIPEKVSEIISDLTHVGESQEESVSPSLGVDADTTISREERRLKIEESLKTIAELKTKYQTVNTKERQETEQALEEEQQKLQELKLLEEQKKREFLAKERQLVDQLNKINEFMQKDNVWSKIYSNYETYKNLEFRLGEIEKRIEILNKKRNLTEKDKNALRQYEEQLSTTEGKLAQLQEYKKEEPFEELLKPIPIGEVPQVSSPLDLINALSFQKHLEAIEEDYNIRFKTLNQTVDKLNEKRHILDTLVDINATGADYTAQLEAVIQQLRTFRSKHDIFIIRQHVLEQEISGIKISIKEAIAKEIKKGIIIGSIILFVLLIFLLVKFLVRKYMSENELFYTTNKAINITFISILVLVLLFSYLEDVGHLVTILSFASAGIAIALKDWFMSIMGWLVIIFSGSLHVGDRVKFLRDGKEYVGDIVDISLLRMTIHEDVTLTTYEHNRRAGRIIFVPNNYIFTEMIANYSHSGLKTVWDGIDFMITFDSDIPKAQSIAKEVTRKYSKGYTDMRH